MKRFVRTLRRLIYYRTFTNLWCLTPSIPTVADVDVKQNSLLLVLEETEFYVIVVAPNGSVVFIDKEDVVWSKE